LILLGWWVLQSLSSEERQQILLRVAEALVVNEERINAENEADVEAAQLNGIAKSLIGRLTIKPGKVSHKSGYRSPLSKRSTTMSSSPCHLNICSCFSDPV
jgi:hypothetical protein